MGKTKIAILGTGYISTIHVESYRRFVPDAEVVAVYTRDTQKGISFAEAHGIRQSYDDLDKLISETDCDIIDICLPTICIMMPASKQPTQANTSLLRSLFA